jgi:hypothetical protein
MPQVPGPAARDWMAARAEDLLPVEYFHVVFTLPAEIAQIAYWNKKAVYDLLFRASAETLITIAADPRHRGARIGMTSVLHTWGSALTHHLISADAETVSFRWKDYRIKTGDRQKVMRLATDEFIRRFLIHVLPDGFHRIRHYGLLASAGHKANVAKIRTLLGAQTPSQHDAPNVEVTPLTLKEPCPVCGGPMRIVEIVRRGQQPRCRAPPRKDAA